MKKKEGLLVVFTLVLAMACTVGIAIKEQQEAKACKYFKRISLKKCDISLSQEEYVWNGQECKPEVSIQYQGIDLILNEDFLVTYKRNIDAGKATVIIKGIGDYRSKVKKNFVVKGLDFNSNCNVILDDANRNVKVYFRGKELDSRYYAFYFTQDRRIIDQQVGPNGTYYVYVVTRTYTVMGKGAFEGTVIKRYTTREHEYIPN